MPQLDFLIIFPQIFWLCLIFSIFYFCLTFVLLPKFIYSLKLRKFILEENSRKLDSNFDQNYSGKTNSSLEIESKIWTLQANFEKLESLLKSNSLLLSHNFDLKLASSTRFTMLFCDALILKNILFFPKVFK